MASLVEQAGWVIPCRKTRKTDFLMTSHGSYLPVNSKASVWNTLCRGGKYITNNCPINEPTTAPKNILLLNNPIWNTDFS